MCTWARARSSVCTAERERMATERIIKPANCFLSTALAEESQETKCVVSSSPRIAAAP